MKIIKLAVLSAALAIAPVASVEAKGFGAELLGTRAQSEWGGEFGLGYSHAISQVISMMAGVG